MKPANVIAVAYAQGKEKASLTVHKGDTVLVKLPMASGSGFVWQVSGKPGLCTQGDTKYENVKTGVPGSSVLEVINLAATTAGTEDISFIYHRPFEKNTAPADTKTLHLIVQ